MEYNVVVAVEDVMLKAVVEVMVLRYCLMWMLG